VNEKEGKRKRGRKSDERIEEEGVREQPRVGRRRKEGGTKIIVV
jgi:hypothetical protein